MEVIMTKQEADEIFDQKGEDVFDAFDDYVTIEEDYEKAMSYYSQVTGCEMEIAREAVLDYTNGLKAVTEKIPKPNIPHCPTCNSTDIKRISTTAKVTNIAMFGLLGNKRKKTFHCNNCKYEW